MVIGTLLEKLPDGKVSPGDGATEPLLNINLEGFQDKLQSLPRRRSHRVSVQTNLEGFQDKLSADRVSPGDGVTESQFGSMNKVSRKVTQ